MATATSVRDASWRCIRASSSAALVFERVRALSQRWQQEEARLSQEAPGIAPLLPDLFYAFYDPDAKLNTDVDPREAWGFSLLATLMASREFVELKAKVQGDLIACASLALHLARSLASAWVQGRAAPSRKTLRQRLLWTLPMRRARRHALDREGHLPQDEAGLRFLVGRSFEMAREALERDQRLRKAWGIWPGARGLHAFDDVWSLLEEVQSLAGFAELTEALQRFQDLLQPSPPRRRRRQGDAGRCRVAGYTQGGELDRVAPEELVRLADPLMSHLFCEAYDHKRLTLYDYQGEKREPCGPLICCMDTSASMNQPAALGRERFVWCKGIGLALMDFAHQHQRPFLGLCFSSEAELEAFALPPGPFDPRLALEMARCDFNGGTHFERPLRHALDYARGFGPEGAKGKKTAGADVVFIADGEASLSSAFVREFLREKAAARLRLFTVLIDGVHEGLAAFSDAVFTVRADRLDSWEAAVRSVGRRLAGV
ncbi:MAG TPA: hypothetical protein VK101_04125 [Limnochordia bacterium]|nr:hypothetical protein [Limnochordia bacterium]